VITLASSLNKAKVKLIPITLDKERHLCFDLNAFSELEEKYGDIETAMKAIEAKSIKAFRAFLWAGLIHEDEDLTEKEVGKMISIDNIDVIVNALSVGLGTALPDAEKAKEVKND
jgi:hypothetical protein